jgi:hypothetical protein
MQDELRSADDLCGRCSASAACATRYDTTACSKATLKASPRLESPTASAHRNVVFRTLPGPTSKRYDRFRLARTGGWSHMVPLPCRRLGLSRRNARLASGRPSRLHRVPPDRESSGRLPPLIRPSEGRRGRDATYDLGGRGRADRPPTWSIVKLA